MQENNSLMDQNVEISETTPVLPIKTKFSKEHKNSTLDMIMNQGKHISTIRTRKFMHQPKLYGETTHSNFISIEIKN